MKQTTLAGLFCVRRRIPGAWRLPYWATLPDFGNTGFGQVYKIQPRKAATVPSFLENRALSPSVS